MALDKSKIKPCFKPLTLESLDGVTLRSINGHERDKLHSWHEEYKLSKDDEEEKIGASFDLESRLIALYLGDKDGKRLIADSEFQDAKELPLVDRRLIIQEGQAYNFKSDIEETKKN